MEFSLFLNDKEQSNIEVDLDGYVLRDNNHKELHDLIEK